MGICIAVASGKGGSGKSTVASNLAAVFAKQNKRVLCIDMDFGMRNLDIAFGLSSRVVFDVTDVISGKAAPFDAMLPFIPKGEKGKFFLFLLPAPAVDNHESMDFRRFKDFVLRMTRFFDYVILDAPAGEGILVAASFACSDLSLIVASCDPASIADAGRVAKIAAKMGCRNTRLVINRFSKRYFSKGYYSDVDTAINAIGVRLIGIVPEDENVAAGWAGGNPAALSKLSRSSKAFYNISARIMQQSVPIMRL